VKPEPTFKHDNGRDYGKKKAIWETSFEMGRFSGEGRGITE